jgi:hypothetical protein
MVMGTRGVVAARDPVAGPGALATNPAALVGGLCALHPTSFSLAPATSTLSFAGVVVAPLSRSVRGFGMVIRFAVVEGLDRAQQVFCGVSNGEVGLAKLEERGSVGLSRVEASGVSLI